MNYSKLFIFNVLLISFVFSACEKTPVIPNEEELITTLKYTLTPTNGGSPIVLSFQDLDGDGGNAAVIAGGTLVANTTYTGSLSLLDETKEPSKNISSEILAEANDHQFFFETTIQGLTVQYNDNDSNGNPLGLSTTVSTGNAGNGIIKITLRHEPEKTAQGVSNGFIANAGGETDIEVTFDVDVQ